MSDYAGLIYELRNNEDLQERPSQTADVMEAAADAIEHLEEDNARLREERDEARKHAEMLRGGHEEFVTFPWEAEEVKG